MKPIMTALVLGAILASAATTAEAQSQERTIRFGYGLSTDSTQGRSAKFLAEEMARLSEGKFTLKTFGDASLGKDEQMQAALIGGAQEMMVGSTATLVGIVKEFGVYDLPFMIQSEKEADAVLDGAFGQKLMAKLPAHGLVGLAYWENGFRNLTNTQRPVAKLEDLQGIKLRVMQNPVFLEVFNGLGANAVPMPFAELFTALETRTVDGQENPVNTILTSKFYEVQKYLSLTRHVYSPWIVLASKKWWDTLSPEEQKTVREAAERSRDFQRKDNRTASQTSLAQLKERGMAVNEVSSDELARMQAAADPFVAKAVETIGTEVVAEYRDAIAAARAN